MRTIKTALKIILLAIPISLLPLSTALAFAGPGAGVTDNPYLISNCTQLQAMSNNLSATYKIIRNINCTGVTFTPVGNNSTPFTGTLNGGGYIVENLTINQPGTSYVGLFGETSGATVSDLGIEEAIIHGASQVGTLAGDATNSSFTNIRIHNAEVDATGNNVGGAVGELGGSGLETSSATGVDVSGIDQVGGLVGWAVGGAAVENSFSEGTVHGTTDIGGLIGQVGSGPTIVDNTYSTGVVNVPFGEDVGGLIGLVNPSSPEVSNSFTTASITGGSDSGTTGGAFGFQSGSIANIVFDEHATGYSSCIGAGSGSGCTGVDSTGSDASHFVNTTSVAPISSWDFDTTWVENSDSAPTLTPLFNVGPSEGPNNNDANGDGIDDSFQPNVNSVENGFGTFSTITVPSSSGCDVENPQWASITTKDKGFTPELKTMTAFTLDCAEAGQTVRVTIIYDKQYDTTGWVLRHYNRTTHKYVTVPGAVFSTKTIGGVKKTAVTYNVTDGGNLDDDGTVNGVIEDPVVPALNPASLVAPDTGNGQPTNPGFVDFVAILALASFGLGLDLLRTKQN